RAVHARHAAGGPGARPAIAAGLGGFRMKRTVLPLLFAGLLGAGLAHAATGHVTASHAWIRVLPGTLPAGAYVALHNDGDQAVSLTGANSVAYGEAMLHESSRAGGMSRM